VVKTKRTIPVTSPSPTQRGEVSEGFPVSTDIPQIPGLLSVMFRLIEARCNEIRSQLPLFEAKSPGYAQRLWPA
jgi:hypothetical protein